MQIVRATNDCQYEGRYVPSAISFSISPSFPFSWSVMGAEKAMYSEACCPSRSPSKWNLSSANVGLSEGDLSQHLHIISYLCAYIVEGKVARMQLIGNESAFWFVDKVLLEMSSAKCSIYDVCTLGLSSYWLHCIDMQDITHRSSRLPFCISIISPLQTASATEALSMPWYGMPPAISMDTYTALLWVTCYYYYY